MTHSHQSSNELQEQIDLLKQELARAQRMSSLGQLVSTTTHEFNNVLTTILNYAKIGLRHKDEPTRDKALQKILIASQRAARITNSVLGMARNRSEAFEPTDLRRLVEESLVLLERELNKHRVQVEMRFDEAPPALAKGNDIQQVLLNLVVNARQAMPKGGRMLIAVSHDESSDTVDLLVRDNGQGMPPEVLRRIFDPFFSTKSGPDSSGKGGTGIGLSACREIIEAHHGKIRVESSVGKGTAFTVKLPAARRPGCGAVTADVGLPASLPLAPT